ncbi:MAG: AAA family ATPase [Thermoplasmata archaeon]
MRITISGPPGSGKTTVAREVARTLGLELILTGKIFRKQAEKAGMNVIEYNRLAEKDATIDKKLDDEIIKIAKEKDDIVVEGRLAGQLLGRNGIESLKVFVTAPLKTRAERIARREKTKPEDELERLKSREESEKRRYSEFYGIDIDDISVYDLVIDSTDISAHEVSEIILREIGKMRA